MHLVCGYAASCNILSTRSHASGFSLNCGAVRSGLTSLLGGEGYLVQRELGLLLLFEESSQPAVQLMRLVVDLQCRLCLRKRRGQWRPALRWWASTWSELDWVRLLKGGGRSVDVDSTGCARAQCRAVEFMRRREERVVEVGVCTRKRDGGARFAAGAGSVQDPRSSREF